MTRRSGPAAMGRRAVDDLARALRDYQLEVVVPAADESGQAAGSLVVTGTDHRPIPVQVRAASTLTPDRAAGLGQFHSRQPDQIGVVVADQISREAKDRLRRSGWSYYDRRGELVLRAPGLIIETNLPPRPSRPGRGDLSPLRTVTGLTLACALLLDPTTPVVLRDVERRSGLDSGNLSRAARALRDQALMRPDATPLVPELFWAVADHWAPQRVAVGRRPPADAAVLGGPMAALAWGAGVVATADYPPDLYVADVARLEHLAASAPTPTPGSEVATLAVAPTPLVCKEPSERVVEGYALVQPLFGALDLAVDRARGVELLEDFAPEGAARVW